MSKPIVAIIGRPNVGKSTLFNKLAGERIAIVEDTPGVTRDRIYAESEWLNYIFTIIDTGGIEPESQDIMFSQMRRQAQIAVETADCILFLVDGKTGVTDADIEIAQMIRKSKNPVLLVVNKIDRLNEEDNAYEFYKLGFGEPIAISSSQGLGLGDMLDALIAKFKTLSTDDVDIERIKIAFVGKPNVGKSSLVNKLLGEERNIVTDIPGTTRDAIDSELDTEFGLFTLIDTAGLRRKSKIKEGIERYSAVRTIASIEKADVCVLIIDANEGISDQDEKIIGYAHELNKAIMILVNKWDTIEKDDKTLIKLEREYRSKLSFLNYAPFVFISALTGQRVNKVLVVAKKCYDSYTKRIQTGILNDVVNNALMMKEPPVVANNRLKIYYVTQVGIKPPHFVFFTNDPKLLHYSYERYIENQIRKSFDFTGCGLKLEFKERKKG
ncbi:MAG: ribosome biogenesis GTPase Der [Oscillospiraceae bacterium]|nr:ribosome biogenesis GTPase Der [Oscillospiraceae bacterium]